MRRALRASAALLLVASCGGPMTPTTPTSSPSTAMVITPGPFLLAVTMATNGSSGFSSCVSLSITGPGILVGPPPTPPLPAPVVVSRSGNAITVRPDDPSSTFRMDLQLAGSSLSGVASGQFQNGSLTVKANGPESSSPSTVNAVVGPASITGVLAATVGNGSMSCTNNGHTFTLSPR